MSAPLYEIFALRYAHLAERNQGSNLIFPDDHEAPMPLDFFVWVIKGANKEAGGRTIMLDTGFDAESAARRNRSWIRSPIAALESIGVKPEDVQDVVLSHLHWDHAGHWHELPNAKFHVQDAEMEYATGRCMCHGPMRLPFDVEQVCTAVRFVYAERVKFHNGTGEIAPGIHVHKVGGHSKGQQILTVPTARGTVVLASDAAHFWHNIRRRSPFVLLHSLQDMIEGWVLCEELADSPDHIIPGHDPEVTRRFPKLPTDENTVLLHMNPIA
jgi:glyoxylase-like metal-dependent hydrolase (beta-lactamase superfamily II)